MCCPQAPCCPTGRGSAPGGSVHPQPAVLGAAAPVFRCRDDVSTVAEGTARGWGPGWTKPHRGWMWPAGLPVTHRVAVMALPSSRGKLRTATWVPVSCSRRLAPGLPSLLGNSAGGVETAAASALLQLFAGCNRRKLPVATTVRVCAARARRPRRSSPCERDPRLPPARSPWSPASNQLPHPTGVRARQVRCPVPLRGPRLLRDPLTGGPASRR